MSFQWSGVFTKDGDRRTFRLTFTALDETVASTIITEYVTGIESEGWKLESNEVKIGG